MAITLSKNARTGTFKGVTIALDIQTLNGIVNVWEFGVFVKNTAGDWLQFHMDENVVEDGVSTPLVAAAQAAGSMAALEAQIKAKAIVDMVAAVNANMATVPGPSNQIMPTTEAEAQAYLESFLASLPGTIPADANGMPTLP